jgi:hypothetical protein
MTSIKLKSGKVIDHLDIKPRDIMYKSVCLFGPSSSGKSVIIRHLMNILRSHIDQVLVISPTESANDAYKGIVPQSCIHSKFYLADPKIKKKQSDKECGQRFLRSLINRQEMLTSYCKKANKLENLMMLYNRIDKSFRTECDAILLKLRRNTDDAIAKIERDKQSRQMKDMKIQSIEQMHQECEIKVIKMYLDKGNDYLSRKYVKNELNDDEKITYEYRNVNPQLLLIMDDLASIIKPFLNTEEMRSLFYQGRHYSITIILSCQSFDDLTPNICKQIFLNFFTTSGAAMSNFLRKSIRYSDEIEHQAKEATDSIFKEKHQKLVFNRETETFYAFKAPLTGKFRFGSESLWELCKKIENDGQSLSKSNPYYDIFAND